MPIKEVSLVAKRLDPGDLAKKIHLKKSEQVYLSALHGYYFYLGRWIEEGKPRMGHTADMKDRYLGEIRDCFPDARADKLIAATAELVQEGEKIGV